MRILHLGSAGNLGKHVIPALLSQGHTVIAYVRSPAKLQKLLAPELAQQITIVQGDAFDTSAVADALRTHNCDAVVSTAGNQRAFWKKQELGPIVDSVTQAAVTVGKERGAPLRLWAIGGMGSLKYPGSGLQFQDHLPPCVSEHHRQTEEVIKKVKVEELEWSLLCVAIMYDENPAQVNGPITAWDAPRDHRLLTAADVAPGWVDRWVRKIPIIGVFLDIVLGIAQHKTKYEDVAALIAEDLTKKKWIGTLVGFKPTTHDKTS